MKTFCIIDVSNIAHRARYSVGKIKTGSFHNPFDDDYEDSTDVRIGLIMNVIFSGIHQAMKKFNADHCVAAFDLRSWRRDFYPEYKANRRKKVKTPVDEQDHEMIIMIIDELRDFLKEYTNVTVLESEGAEADDLIARWIQIHDEPDFHHIIISSDGDFKQLVRENVDLYNPMGSSKILYTIDGVFQQGGKKKKSNDIIRRYNQDWIIKKNKKDQPETFDPEWELFEKCIRGDISDNIKSAWPGVYTTKMKKAFYGSIETYNNFINSTWGKDGKKNSVRELYERNKTLIDLTAQPEEIQIQLDESICDALEQDRVKLIGAHFARFCGRYDLPKLLKQADSYADILSRAYAD